MQFSIFSFFMSQVWVIIFVISIYLFTKNKYFIRNYGVTSLLSIVIVVVQKMFFPFEISKPILIESKVIYPKIQEFLYYNLATAETIVITPLIILCTIWISIAIFFLIRFFIQYFNFYKNIKGLKPIKNKKIEKIMSEIKGGKYSNIKTRIYYCINDQSPFMIGFFCPKIFLTKSDYDDETLYHILLHEWTHFLNKDTWVKLLVQILTSIFWWNPFIFLLEKDLSQILEIKCDLKVTDNFSLDEKSKYLKNIISIIKNCRSSKSSFHLTTYFGEMSGKEKIKQRFSIVLDNTPQHRRARNLIFITFFLLTTIASNVFLLQPTSEAPEIDNEVTSENTYIEKNSDGAYDIYTNDKLVATYQNKCEIIESFVDMGVIIKED